MRHKQFAQHHASTKGDDGIPTNSDEAQAVAAQRPKRKRKPREADLLDDSAEEEEQQQDDEEEDDELLLHDNQDESDEAIEYAKAVLDVGMPASNSLQ